MINKKKRIISLLIVLLLMSLLASCKNVSVSNSNTDMESTIKWLTSKKLEGRMTGTKGNLKTQDKIAKHFKDLGLETVFGEGYLQTYSQMVNPPKEQKFSLEVYSNGTLSKKAVYGVDYLFSGYGENVNIDSKVIFDSEDINKEDTSYEILVAEKSPNFDTEKYKCVLVKTDVFKKNVSYSDNLIPRIQISSDFYSYLTSLEEVSLKIETAMKREEVEVANVIGKLSGKDQQKAIILSAHFDHVGKIGEQPVEGAVDNAAAVALLLDIANKLKQLNPDELAYDIIFFGINGEETGLLGSEAFVGKIKEKYQDIVNINLDTLGIKGDDTILIAHFNEKDQLVETLENNLSQLGYKIEATNRGVSDHVSFAKAGIPAITLSNKNFDFIHTVEDKIEKVDFKLLENLSEGISEFIKLQVQSLFNNSEAMVETEETKKARKRYEIEEQAKQELKLNEFKVIEIDGEPTLIKWDYYNFKDYEEFSSIYPDILIPQKVNEFNLVSSINVNTGLTKNQINVEEYELNKVYQYNPSKEGIYAISLMYHKEDDSGREMLSIGLMDIENEFGVQWSLDGLVVENINMKGTDYKVVYTENKDEIQRIQYEVMYESKPFTINIKSNHMEWEDPKDLIQYIEDLDIDIDTFIKAVFF